LSSLVIWNWIIALPILSVNLWMFIYGVTKNIYHINMKVHLTKLKNILQFEGINPSNDIVSIGATESVGGTGIGTRPMELLLHAIAGCASIDVCLILEKQRQVIKSYEVIIQGRRVNEVPAYFETIHMDFVFSGDLDDKKVQRAVELSVEKYCSVAKTIDEKVKITYSYKIN
jgi:putative redox protein